MTRKPLLNAGFCVSALASQHRQRYLALQRIQVIAQRTACDRLPMTVGSQRLDLLLDPAQTDALAEVEIGLGGVAYPDARRHGDFDQIQRAVRFLEGCDARSKLLRNMLLHQL